VSSPIVLALDVGTSSVRAHRFDGTAAEVGEPARREYEGEIDPDRLVARIREAIAEAGGAEGVEGVGTSCFGHSLLALDRQGRPLTPVLSWRDTRSADAAEGLLRRVDGDAVHARTGCQIHTSYWPAKLAWLAQEEPDVFGSAIASSRSATTSTNSCSAARLQRASRCIATGLVDLQTRAWDVELLETLGLTAERLPEISDAPVDGWYPALLDGACSNFGAGCLTRERAALMVGTSGAMRAVYETERPHPREGLFLHWVDETRVVEGGSLSDGGNLHAWLEETLRDASGSLADRDPSSHGLTFLTLLGGERSPGWHQHAKGAVHGLTFDTTPLDLRQAGLEGVAFRFAEIADLLQGVEEIVATGGGLVGDPDWVQIMADALGRPVTMSAVREASLRGAAVTRSGESGARQSWRHSVPLSGLAPARQRRSARRASASDGFTRS
jgi:Sugar (pentulose and hexulose) kinases